MEPENSHVEEEIPNSSHQFSVLTAEFVVHRFSVAIPGLVSLLAGHFLYSFTGGVHQNH